MTLRDRGTTVRIAVAIASAVLAVVGAACSAGPEGGRVRCSAWGPGPNAPADGAAVVAVVRTPFLGRDGGHLVYRDPDNRIFARRTATGEEREIVLADDASIYAGSVDGARFVAYTSRPPDNYQEYFAVDLESCSALELGIRVSTSGRELEYSVMGTLSLSGDRLFYSISRGSLRDAQPYVLDLETLVPRAATSTAHTVYSACLDGDEVAWLQKGTDDAYAVGDWNVSGDAVRTFALPTLAAPQGLAASSGRAVWTDHRDVSGYRNEHVFLLDLASGAERRVSSVDSRQTDPTILGHLVAWADGRSGRFAIRLLDLDSGVERQVAGSPTVDLRWPRLTQAGLFWVEPSSGGSAVYLDPTIRP